MKGPVPIAVVSITFRDAPTQVRDACLRADDEAGGPGQQLLERGHATGLVRIQTCSRIEWVISSPEPRWAGELLRGALASRAGVRPPRLRTGFAAAHYLCRVASGLDSLAEGEAAVARQVLKAFSDAHAQKRTDRTLNLVWNQLGKLVHHKRLLVSRPGIGVQKLVVDDIAQRRVEQPIVLFGSGQIGRSIQEALRAQNLSVKLFNRATRGEFDLAVASAPLVVLASGAPQAWLSLPARNDGPVLIDVGSPAQVVTAPGWTQVGLDQLLSSPGCLMSDDELARLDALIDTQLLELIERLHMRTNETLSELTQFRTEFVNRVLSRLGDSVSDPQVLRDIRRDISEATHALVLRTKGQP